MACGFMVVVVVLEKLSYYNDDDIIKDVPQLPSVTSLTIEASSWFDGHAVGASIAKFIANTFASIFQAGYYHLYCSEPGCLCHQPEDWKDQMISLENLTVVDIRRFAPLDDRRSLVQLLFASSPALDTMTVELHGSYLVNCREEGKEYQFDMPCYQGYWNPCAWEFGVHKFNCGTKFKWTREMCTNEAYCTPTGKKRAVNSNY
uniref:FBD domain-containing protein n=1 Tax=Oryza barthii TaxID=65489 RepID=A0A0D3HV55_9ORYZ